MKKTTETTPTNYAQAFAAILRKDKSQGYCSLFIEQKNELINSFNQDQDFFFPCKYSLDCDADVILNLHLLCKRLGV